MQTTSFDEERICAICRSNEKIVTDPVSGELVCNRCGVVLKATDNDDPGANSIAMVPGERPHASRIPTSALFDKHGVESFVGLYNKDAFGNEIPNGMGERLRKVDNRFVKGQSAKGRAINSARLVIMSMCDQMHLPKTVREGIAEMYYVNYEKKLSKGRTRQSLIAALGYIVCKRMNVIRSADDFASAVGISKKEFSRVLRFVVAELELGSMIQSNNAGNLIPRICNKLQLSATVERAALGVWQKIKDDIIVVGKHPGSIASVIIYYTVLVSGNHITQKVIASAADVTEMSLRNNAKKLQPYLEKAFPVMPKTPFT